MNATGAVKSPPCEWCAKHPAAFGSGEDGKFLLCKPCAKRHGLILRGEIKGSLDMLELAATYALRAGATPSEVRAVIDRAPASFAEGDGPFGGEIVEHGAPDRSREWKRGLVPLLAGGEGSVGPSPAKSDQEQADGAVEIDLTKPYHREFVTHVLGGVVAALCEEVSLDTVASPYINTVLTHDRVVGDFLAEFGPLEGCLRDLKEAQTADSISWRRHRGELDRGALDCYKALCESLAEEEPDNLPRLLNAVQPIASLLTELQISAGRD